MPLMEIIFKNRKLALLIIVKETNMIFHITEAIYYTCMYNLHVYAIDYIIYILLLSIIDNELISTI